MFCNISHLVEHELFQKQHCLMYSITKIYSLSVGNKIVSQFSYRYKGHDEEIDL